MPHIIHPETVRKMAGMGHRVAYMVPIILTPICFILVCFFNALAASPAGSNLGVFRNNTGEIARRYDTEVQPAGWTFSIWGVIYAWQGLWIVYGLTTLCRQGISGYLYFSPPFNPPLLYISYSVNLLLNIGWLFSWDREVLPLSVIVLAFMAFTLYICLFESFRAMAKYEEGLAENGLMVDVWLVRFLVQNGLGIYAAWVSIATLVNLSVTLTYNANLANQTSSTICLSILLAEILLWVGMDILFLDRFTRYLFTPHCVVVFALTGVVVKNYQPGNTNSILSVVLLALGIAALASKITIMIIRHVRSPAMKVDITRDIPMITVDDTKHKHKELY